VPDRFVIVLPTYNERENLGRLVDALAEVREQTPFPGDVLIVDDASPDGTGALAADLARRHEWVHVLHRPAKLGLGRAYLDGFRWALERDYTHILEMDADLSHPPEAVPRLLEAATDADLVLGSRYVPGGGVAGWPAHRRLISRAGSLYARTLLGVGIRDLTGGFKCFHRRVLEAADLDSVHGQGYVFQIELTYRTLRMGGRVVEVPITFCDRTAGSSKMTPAIVAEAVWKVPVLRLRARRTPIDGRLRGGAVASLVASRPPL
jgi:dolichol-phosphate mannosyltransferase